jgi:4-amino-4-deoxy-L-arabinose transferase-like glycosyltransferase
MFKTKELNYVIILAIYSFFISIGMIPLFDLDEGAFSEATREMLVSGDYITTYLNGELRFDKPILIYWLQLVSIQIFGINEFGFRFPSALASIFWAIGIFLFTKRYFSIKVALFASIAMVSSLQIALIAKAAIADALLNLFIASSMFMVYIYYETKNKKYLYLTFVFIGLGALTKGPVAIFVPFMVTLIFFSIKREFIFWLKSIFDIRGLAIFAIIALPWYIAEYMAQGQLFIDGFFLKHNVNRFSGSLEGHSGTLLYFLPVVIIGFLPFTSVLFRVLKDTKKIIKDDLKLFLFVWFLFVFLFFSFSGTKLPHYVIYGYTPMFILIGLYISEIKSKFLLYLPIMVLSTILLFLPEILGYISTSTKDEFTKDVLLGYEEYFGLFYRFIFLAIFFIFFIAKKYSIETNSIILAIYTIFIVNFVVMPNVGNIKQLPLKEAGLIVKENNYKDVLMWGLNTPSFNVYANTLVEKRELRDYDKNRIVVTKTKYLKEIKEYKLLYKKHGIVLIKVLKPFD